MLSSVTPLSFATSTSLNGGASAARAVRRFAARRSAAAANRFISGECKLRPEIVPRFRVHVAVCLAALCVVPVRVAAQEDAFRDALIGFHAKLAGEHSDEGPAIVAALDRMASAL